MGKENRYRYPGINFFTKEDQDIFCGRADDSQKLFNRIMINNTVVLHGDSGSGKSSLVQAGLIPLLENQNQYLKSQHKPQYLPVTVRLDSISKISIDDNNSEEGDGDILIRQITKGINEYADCKAKELPFLANEKNSFWYTAKLFERNNYSLLLILDQFEELQGYSNKAVSSFTKKLAELFVSSMPEEIYEHYDIKTAELFNAKGMSDEERKEYNENIKFIEQPLNVRILFVVREDKLGTMSLLSDYFPDILKNDFFLLPLNETGAKSAIVQPAQKEGNFRCESFRFDDQAIVHLLTNLVDSNGLYDPIQLQIVCSNIERKIAESKRLIRKEDIPPVGDITRDFYMECWKGIQKEFKLTVEEYEVRRSAIIENLVVGNSRNLVLEKLLIADSNKLDEGIVKSLVKEGLLRRIPTGNETYYQLIHDRLMPPLNDDLLELKVKEAAKAEKQQREKELVKTRKRLRTVYSLLGLALIALVAAGYSWSNANSALNAAKKSEEKADSLKTIAEKNAKDAITEKDRAIILRKTADSALIIASNEKKKAISNLIKFKEALAKNQENELKSLESRAYIILNADGCPEEIVKKMILLARQHKQIHNHTGWDEKIRDIVSSKNYCK